MSGARLANKNSEPEIGDWSGKSKTWTVIMNCPWCEVDYDLDPKTERRHLAVCKVFQTLPVAAFKDGKTFVALPSDPEILVERERIQ